MTRIQRYLQPKAKDIQMEKVHKFADYNNQTSDLYREDYRGYTIRRAPDPQFVQWALYQGDKRVTTPSGLSGVVTNPQIFKNQIDKLLGPQDKPKQNKNEVTVGNWIIFKTGLGLWKIRSADEVSDVPDQLRGQFSDGQYALDAINDWEKNYAKRGIPQKQSSHSN